MEFKFIISKNGTSAFDLGTTREMITSPKLYDMRADAYEEDSAEEDYGDYVKDVPRIFKLKH